MIKVDIRTGDRRPTIGITGSLSLLQERQLRKIGASRSDPKPCFNSPFDELSHYYVPLPLVRRLFNPSKDPTKWRQPGFMVRWRQLGNGLVVTSAAIECYKNWLATEKEIAGVKKEEESVITAVLERHDIGDDFFEREPKPHQRAGLAFFLLSYEQGAGHILLFDEMRTGKTKQTIDIARFLLREKKISNIIIICPNSVKRVWMYELQKDAALHASFSIIVTGSKAKRREIWNQGFYFYITNYESVRNDSEEVYSWQANCGTGYMLIIDESHKLKNPASLQTRVILGGSREYAGLKPDYSVCLTGTPVANTPIDVFTSCHFACPGILNQNLNWFKHEFTIRGGRTGSDVVGYKNLDEIRWRLARVSMRRRRQDIMFDESVIMPRYGKLAGEQLKTYGTMRDTLYAELQSINGEFTSVQARNHLAKILRLQQITDGYLSPEPGIVHWFDGYGWKIKELDEFLAEYLESLGKIVIWSRFVPPLMMLLERYQKYNALIVRGQMGDEAIDNMYRFQQEAKYKVMLAQIQTSEGKGFQPATTAVFLDKWMSPHLNKQAADRIVGIENPVTVCIVPFITEDTIDERIEFLLEKKKDWADAVTGDTKTNEIILPRLDKSQLLYLLANPDEARLFEGQMELEGVTK